MSDIILTSTTDSAEAVAAVQGGSLPKVDPVETSATETKIPVETLENSEALEDTDLDEGDDETTEENKTPKKKNGIQKRIGKLNARISAAEQKAQYWEQEALKQQRIAQPKIETEITKPSADGKPTSDKFTTHEDYVEALTEWKVDQRLTAEKQQSKQQDLKSQQDLKLKSYLEKRDAFAKGHDDYFERMADINNIPMSITVNEALLDNELGPELIYELAKDPEEYKRICNLSVVQAALEIGKLSERLAKPKATEAKQTTKAPKPIEPVGSGSASANSKPLGDLDFEAYKAARLAGRTA